MTGWWQRARVVSAVGAGALILGGGSAVSAISAGSPVPSPRDLAGADDLNSWSRWVRANDVIRFRVWLKGTGTDARLTVTTKPAQALKHIECPLMADAPMQVAPMMGAPAPVAPAVAPVAAAPAVTPAMAAPAPAQAGPQVCSMSEVGMHEPVDVLLAMPEKAEDIELTAVARLRDSRGEWVIQTAQTTIESPAARAARAAEVAKAAQIVREGEPVAPRPAPGLVPRAPGALAEGIRGDQTRSVRSVGEIDLVPVQVIPGKALQGQGEPVSPSVREVPGVPWGPEAQAIPPDPRLEAQPAAPGEREGVPVVPGDPLVFPPGAPAEERPPGAKPRVSGGSKSANQGVKPEQEGSETSKKGGRGAGTSRKPMSARTPASPLLQIPGAQSGLPPAIGQQNQPAVPTQMPPVSDGLVESGRMPGLWNDPQLRMPLAAPTPIEPPPSSVAASSATANSQPLGAPLPRDVDGPGGEIKPVAESNPLLTGIRGLPAVGVAVGGLLGLLWLQVRIHNRRGRRPVL
ncbi:hypothetical protein [Streptosporangium sp. NPDC000396]|uniref:hypothetical protein n=1 Tax=Streptosporangium sp. NPDC000396 TaxID=3366185 RepID=UPI00369FD7EB